MTDIASILRGRLAELVPAERCGTSPVLGAPKILLAGARQVLGRTTAVVALDGGGKVAVDLATPHGRKLYAYGFCEPASRALRALLRPGAVVIDAGANIGLFTVLAAAGVGPAGRVLALEPSPTTMALLRANVARNAYPWVDLHEVAVAEAPGRLEIEIFDAGSGFSSFAPAAAGSGRRVEVEVTTLDALAGEWLDRVSIVKIDVEGAELRALRGAARLLERARPDFILELEPEHLERQGSSAADLQRLFEDAGYDGYAIGARGFQRLEGAWHGRDGDPNIVIRPRERGTPGRRVLMFSHYPPMRGGISAYAAQAVATLRANGDTVTVASPEPSDADHVLDLTRPGAGREFARLAHACDELIVQFHPELLGPPGSTQSQRSRALLRLARGLRAAPHAELCLHEVNYGAGRLAPLLQRLVRQVWRQADVISVHSENERDDFTRAYGIDPARVQVVSQGANMIRHVADDRAGARSALGLDADARILVAIGFLQPNKGFDRALRAFAAVAPDAQLYVVGSAWREDEDRRGYIDELHRLAAAAPGAQVREAYLSDEDFDRWIVASDGLVLPYVHGWSSNVMERGLLYGRPVIMSRIGGMADQGADRPGVTLVGDDAELEDAVRRLALMP